jgi:hypothetical protein
MTSRSLIGTELDQVPVNGMLGGLAYQSSENAAIKNLNLKNLTDIDTDINDTAVDVFVYDTSKDSDGGAWRYRTQSTSWYNETLGTATRGTRKEFPAVAVIVLESSRLKIYDGDDPDLPLWMEFINTSGNLIGGSAMTSVTALNGIIVTGSGGYCMETRFISDYSLDWFTDQLYEYRGNIEQRNDTLGFRLIESYGIISSATNDVAMTVLPNASIDPTTGLQIPTIAIGTTGGLSVIREDGKVYDVTYSAWNNITEVFFTKDNLLAHLSSNTVNQTYGYHYIKIPFGDFNNGSDGRNPGTYDVRFYNSDGRAAIPSLGAKAYGHSFIDGAVGYSGDCPSCGLTLLEKDAPEDYENSSIAFIRTNYNTGWMHGDIKGAFLSDTDTANITGSELITNGGFNSNVSGWTSQNSATITHTTPSSAGIDSPATDGLAAPSSAGIIKIVSNGSASGAYQAFTTVVGKTYTASFLAYQVSYSSNYVKIGTSPGGHENYDFYNEWDQSVNNNWASGSATFTATSTTTYITLWPSQVSGRVLYMDQISVRLADPDRSVNERGIQVFGTITKSPVETNADLVAYSGFSGTNVLRQSPNSDMNLGTSDAHIMAWYKTSGGSGNRMVMSYEGGAAGTSDYGKPFNIRMVSGKITGWASHNNFSSWNTVYDPVDSNDGKWHCAVWVRSGSNFLLYKDGEGPISHWGSAGVAEVHNGGVGNNALSDENTELVIGARKRGKAPGATDHQEPFDGSIALARIGKSAPSAEQIKKMYDEEKVLFQENAKCTLHGSSDAVTALAYDDSTNLLVVGTSSGRSDFSNLKRVDHSTLAVTTAISAHDGLIAQQ